MKKTTLQRLRSADPESFAELCERAGYNQRALDYYSKSNQANDIFHAAEIAFKLRKYPVVRQLLKKTKNATERGISYSNEGIRDVEMRGDGSGMMGAVLGAASANEEFKLIRGKISEMERKLAEVGK